MRIMFRQGEPPIFNAAVEYKIIAWGVRDGADVVFFNTGEMVISSPFANALGFSPEQIQFVKANYPLWPLRPLPDCSR